MLKEEVLTLKEAAQKEAWYGYPNEDVRRRAYDILTQEIADRKSIDEKELNKTQAKKKPKTTTKKGKK